MRLTSLSTPTYSTPRRAGLQAQASTANVAQAQKAEAFTPSGRIQRQGFKNVEQLERFATHIEKKISENTFSIPKGSWLDNISTGDSLQFPYVPAWERTLEKLNEAIAFHKNLSPAPANSGVFGWVSQIKKQFKHAYLSHKFRLNNLGRYLDLPQMEFSGLNLSGATLDGADFTKASFAGANLDRASLRKTKLEGTNFNSAFLCRTSFKGARISRRGSNPTIFYGAYDLDKAYGLPKDIDKSRESLEAWW
jgi:hypothetical protein